MEAVANALYQALGLMNNVNVHGKTDLTIMLQAMAHIEGALNCLSAPAGSAATDEEE